ncbi:hypothetical protein BCR22_04725 [Enterococcus plantarum]|uniref:YxeA family protein n=1 Tax=Enterococcus plantarum TaxID=1077675 RepID=A0A2W3Z0I7_9ENTE|nr:YxeA family protein [Enterococcus plantarum]MBO0423014.1 YxeA family protein [Enterococcus plantarum]MBO0468243.1 YxeA family protein [Enterococcus plantarum]OEG12683.1 hypothetical protein BCR22_04725 [Enterococcus plantarum]PZL73411.1 hypothetical protein CI088_08760 [Enterococcus plantarum]
MKIIKTIIVIAILGGVALFGAKLYTQNHSDELSGTIDQLNPLVPEGEVYVKTKKADSINSYGITTYKQQSFDKEGKSKEIIFTADHELQTDRYLKIYNKGAHIETYEEVSEQDIPEKALKQLHK